MGEFITIQPIKKPDLTPTQELNIQVNFAHWRFHLWGKNYGSYEQIERKVQRGKLESFVCPDKDCDCSFEKLK